MKRKSAQTEKSKKSRARTRTATVNAVREMEQEIRNKRFTRADAVSGRQSDFQGLSRSEKADSESVTSWLRKATSSKPVRSRG